MDNKRAGCYGETFFAYHCDCALSLSLDLRTATHAIKTYTLFKYKRCELRLNWILNASKYAKCPFNIIGGPKKGRLVLGTPVKVFNWRLPVSLYCSFGAFCS